MHPCCIKVFISYYIILLYYIILYYWGYLVHSLSLFPRLWLISLSFSFSLSECHISCSGCTGGSFQNCTSCIRPSVLHQGQCLDKCPHGFHVQDRICQGVFGCYSVLFRRLCPCGLVQFIRLFYECNVVLLSPFSLSSIM